MVFAHISHTMATFTNPTTLFQPQITISHHHHRHHRSLSIIRATLSNDEETLTNRRKIVTTLLTTSISSLLGLNVTPIALAQNLGLRSFILERFFQPGLSPEDAVAQNWGTRSFILERFFQPGLSPEDAVARIRQTADGLRSIRNMLETKSWRYVLFYVRLKMAYLSQDMTNAMSMVPEGKRKSYVKTANELVDNMSELDYYVRTPKIYESYLYYEKTLQSIDELVVLLA